MDSAVSPDLTLSSPVKFMKLIALSARHTGATGQKSPENDLENHQKDGGTLPAQAVSAQQADSPLGVVADAPGATVSLPNDADPLTLALDGVQRIELNFPKFTDGRAYSQAFLLRRRRGFTGEIRATGDVLIDQLVQMHRTGFDTAVLRADLDIPGVDALIERQFARFSAFYQGDAVTAAPLFARAVA